MKKVLIACEESQTVCRAFREQGWDAYSCDLMECSGGHPEWHIQGDALPLINGNCKFMTMDGESHRIDGEWDLLIAHPPCTYLSNAGARWLFAGGKLNMERYQKGLQGKQFFEIFLRARCDHIAVENPIPSSVYQLPNPTQVIQPYEHGEEWSKKTYLWLKNLPPLMATEIVVNPRPYCPSCKYTVSHDPFYLGASRRGGSARSRSKTFPGIAKAMAVQWGNYIDE